MAKEHILVVDDEEDILELVRYNLAKEGYRVTTVASGEEALRSARSAQAGYYPAGSDAAGSRWFGGLPPAEA